MKTIPLKPTKAHARKIIHLLSFGLVSGLGEPEPGKMCVEAAVNFAMGQPHGDEPPCVGAAVRAFKIKLNDCSWPDNTSRAEGMKRLAIAQLGSNELNQMAFGKLMFLRGTQHILPFVWRKESKLITDPQKKAVMLDWCERMEKVSTFNEAHKLTKSATATAYATAFATAFATAIVIATAYAYASTTATATAYAYAYAYAIASASAYASAYAYATAYRHELLKLTAQVGVDVLIEMKSPGCKWLTLCD